MRPAGLVFNGNYVTYVDVALTEMWRERFGSYDQMLDEFGVDLVVGSVTLDLKASARPDDLIDVGREVANIGTTSMTCAIHMRLRESSIVIGAIRAKPQPVTAAGWGARSAATSHEVRPTQIGGHTPHPLR